MKHIRDEPKGRLKARSVLAAVFLAAIALSAHHHGETDDRPKRTTPDGQDGVNYSILTQTPDPVDQEASTETVKTFWESKGFTTRTETNPKDTGLIRLYADQNGGQLMSYYANVKGSGL